MEKQAYILTNITLSLLWRLRKEVKKRPGAIYFDSFSWSKSSLLWLFSLSLGNEKFMQYIARLGRLYGLQIKLLPHATVQDYHLLNIQAVEETVVAFEKLVHEKDVYKNHPISKQMHFDECSRSVYFKELSDRVWRPLENVKVLKEMGFTDVTVFLNASDYPTHCINAVLEKEAFTVIYSHDFSPLTLTYVTLSCLRDLLVGFWRTLKRKPQGRTAFMLAVEAVDPDHMKRAPSEPGFLFDETTRNLIAYVRQYDPLWENVQAEYPLIFLDQIKMPIKVLPKLAGFYWSLLLSVVKGRSFHSARLLVQQLRLYTNLYAFFYYYNIQAHCFNVFPNGKTGIRPESGIITDVARQFGVRSISYQTRVLYLHDRVYYYDVLDTFFVWGSLWQDVHQFTHFIRDFQSVGNVYLDTYQTSPKVREPKPYKSVVLFTSDLETVVPQHCTLDYNISFIKDVIEATKCIHDSTKQKIHLLIKTKEPEHYDIIMQQEAIASLLKKANLVITALPSKRHEVKKAIDEADLVLSIGFTTPGLEAALKSKDSVYYTPYERSYNSIFSYPSNLVLHNSQEVKNFILNGNKLSDDFLNGLDPFRDGQSAQRIIHSLHSELRGVE